ncbi:MAG: hypothetical protein GY866_41735 [Proteobacteria bacterium]|nr:hypothetical protein [Pseudomonadota bacterium]
MVSQELSKKLRIATDFLAMWTCPYGQQGTEAFTGTLPCENIDCVDDFANQSRRCWEKAIELKAEGG